MKDNVYYFPNTLVSTKSENLEFKEKSRGQNRKPKKRRFSPKFFFIGLLLILIVFDFSKQVYLQWKLKGEIVKLENTLVDLAVERKSLEDKVAELQESAAIEKLAREKLGLVKKGETVIMQAIPGENKPKTGEYEAGD